MANNHIHNPETSFYNQQFKDKKLQSQSKRVYYAFMQPKTMLMVSVETGILRANICRIVAELSEQNRIALVKRDICEISKHYAGFYTTNPKLFPAIVEP